MELIVKFFMIASLIILAIESGPTNWVWHKLFYKWPKVINFIKCPLCFGFWIGLAFTFNPLQAAAISIIASLLHKNIISGL